MKCQKKYLEELEPGDNCGNCAHNLPYIAGITYRICECHEHFGGLSRSPHVLKDMDFFCAYHKRRQDETD